MVVRVVSAPPTEDAELVAQFLDGDVGAFDELYHRHARYVAGVVFRLLGDRRDLVDVVQETFVAALESVARLRRPECFRTWLVGIAVRRVRRRLYQASRRERLRALFAASSPTLSDPAAASPAEELQAALKRVDARFRVPWILHHLIGETLPVVAEIEGVSLATIKRRIARADDELRRLDR